MAAGNDSITAVECRSEDHADRECHRSDSQQDCTTLSDLARDASSFVLSHVIRHVIPYFSDDLRLINCSTT
jgi:hypothetical protein